RSSPTARGGASSVRAATFGIEAQGGWAAHVRIGRIGMRTAARCPTKVSMRRLHEPKDGYTEVREERHRDQQGGQGIHGRGTSGDEGARPRAEGGSAPRPAREEGGRGKRRAREDCRDAETGSRHGRAAPCQHQSKPASTLTEHL